MFIGKSTLDGPHFHPSPPASHADAEGIFIANPSITGWWLGHPSEKYDSQLGWLFPIYGKIKLMFQTTNQISLVATMPGLGSSQSRKLQQTSIVGNNGLMVEVTFLNQNHQLELSWNGATRATPKSSQKKHGIFFPRDPPAEILAMEFPAANGFPSGKPNSGAKKMTGCIPTCCL